MAPVALEEGTRPPSIWRAMLGSLEGRLAVGILAAVLALIVFGPFFAPYDPTELAAGLPLEGASSDHILGVDQLGRDLLSRFLHGGRSVMIVPLIATTLAYLVGGPLGLWAGYRRGWFDSLLSRVFDLLLTLPPLLLILVLVAGLGTSALVLVIIVALVYLPRTARVVRAATQTAVHQDYVVSAQARGERTATILVREILPNLWAPILADFALRLTYAIGFVATLSFLGLGAQPPSSDWGLMISESRNVLLTNPAAAIAPAVGIGLLSMSFNLLADAITRHIAREADEGIFGL